MSDPNEPSQPSHDEDLEAMASTMRRGGRRRSPVLSVVVMMFGVYLLVTMFGDVVYWLQPREPRMLGNASEVLRDGAVDPAVANRYVVLEGTPDVQHAARLQAKDKTFGYVRIVEGGGSLFAAMPRQGNEPQDNFEGRFEGRMMPLGRIRSHPFVKQFFDAEGIVTLVDVERTSLLEALRTNRRTIEDLDGHLVETTGDDRIRIVVDQPDALVQLGKTTFPRASDAEAAVARLGYPYVRAEREAQTFHVFHVRVPVADRPNVSARLQEGLSVPANTADPKLGVAVLPRTTTYVAKLSELAMEGDKVIVPAGEHARRSTLEVGPNSKLQPTSGNRTSIAIDPAIVAVVRLERSVVVAQDAYVVLVGVTPDDEFVSAMLWLLVLVIVIINATTLVLVWHRRAS